MSNPQPRSDHVAAAANRAPTVPWATHVVAALAFTAWIIGTDWRLVGIVRDEHWWWPWATTDMTFELSAVCALAAVVFAAIETLAVVLPLRLVARTVAVISVLVVGFLSALPARLRFPGDEEPVLASAEMLFLYLLWLAAGLQLLLTAAGIRVDDLRRQRRMSDPDWWDEAHPPCPECGHRLSAHAPPGPSDWTECGACVLELKNDQRQERDICGRRFSRP